MPLFALSWSFAFIGLALWAVIAWARRPDRPSGVRAVQATVAAVVVVTLTWVWFSL
jgi:hypothetical protein